VLTQEQIKLVFNLKNPRAVEYLDNYGVTRVTQIDTTSSDILRKLLTDGIAKGYSYSKLATQIKKQFTDWSTKRAKLVAVTELGNAYQQGNLIVGMDLKAAGLEMQKSWLTRGDDKVDPHCSANADDGWIDVEKTHSSGAMVPLDHPRCRCVELYRRKPKD
jgi:SPP1 gp7 family putative phage head morphogenesis protein